MRKQYPFDQFEPYWQQYWLKNNTFRAANPGEPNSEKPKFYVLDMFPYPSGAGLHVGHLEGYTATDIIARYKRMRGYNVLHPMGWDAFGLPAEQHAIATGTHPRLTTQRNIANFKRQIQAMGFSYDWQREINTTDPKYYRWTQWIFLQLYHRGLAYVSDAPVWYCPELGTVLANEEVISTPEGPRSERGNHPVERRPLRQWMLRITAYAERLLRDLNALDWPESLKEMQRNWIGRSEGATVRFNIDGHPGRHIEVFTTRPDTLFGATYIVLAPEHPIISEITTEAHRQTVCEYQKHCAQKSDLDRTDLNKDKTGVFTGAYAINPANQARIPIWIADYVLITYGTGAIMAVPAHDDRDYAFAQKYHLPIIQVVRPTNQTSSVEHLSCFTGEGIAINSSFLDGLTTAEAKTTMIQWLESNNLGKRHITYKLRDWLFSRQRYWGEPFPIIWRDGKPFPLSEEELPLTLPELEDFQPSADGSPPLSKAKQWVQLPDASIRETNTMPQWAGSCWYYLRYCDPHNDTALISPEVEKYWLGDHGVDLYIGGAEHAVLHLLYARFWHKVLYDIGIVSTPEPFHKLVNQGLILGEDNQKMSKSLGNVVNPDEIIAEYGADAVRLFEMFMGPLEQTKPWSTKGVEGVYRFLGRVWRLVMEENDEGQWQLSSKLTDDPPPEIILRTLHYTIQKVTNDLEKLSFNTAIAQLMILVNELTKADLHPRSVIEPLVLMLSPMAPHIGEELWKQLGHTESLAYEPWPQADPRYLAESTVEIPVQINGKVRGTITIAPDTAEETAVATAKAAEGLQSWIQGRSIVKVVYVPKKILNLVVK